MSSSCLFAHSKPNKFQNILAEATFVCPSYWLNSAYTAKTNTYHYQYSVPFASHGNDVTGYFGPSAPNQSPSFSQAFRSIWGNFITSDSPLVSSDAVIKTWPEWTGGSTTKMLNLNETGGVPYQATTNWGATVTQFMDPGLVNSFSVVNAYSWEGGRGKRCDFWKSVADKVPI